MRCSASSACTWPVASISSACPPHMPAAPAADARLCNQPTRSAASAGASASRLECACLQGIASKDCGGFVEGDVHRWAAATQRVIVHGRQIIVHQRIRVDQFHRHRWRIQAAFLGAEQGTACIDQQRTHALAATEHGVAHGRVQTLRGEGGAGKARIQLPFGACNPALKQRRAHSAAIQRRRLECFCLFGARGVGHQTHAQFRLFQRLLAIAVQPDAALVGGERLLEAHLAHFHLLHQLLEFFQRLFEAGDGEDSFKDFLAIDKVCGARAGGSIRGCSAAPVQARGVRTQPLVQRGRHDLITGGQQCLAGPQQGQARAFPRRQV